MVKNALQLLTLPVVTALVATGCCNHSSKTARGSPSSWSEQAQGGAPAVEQGTAISSGMGGAQTVNQADIELRKEELVVGKREINNGGVLIRKVVQTENVSQPVELRREEYVIERIPAGDPRAVEAKNQNADLAFQQQEFFIPLTREEPVASKRTLLTENVQLSKRVETNRETISRPVRWEDVQVSKVEGKATGSYWQDSAPPTAAGATSEANAFELAREEMVVGKKDVDNGGVILRKIVHTETASQPIDLKREEFSIDRTPVSGEQLASADFTPKEYRLNLLREEAVAGVRSYPTEWVHVRKQNQTDNQIVTGTVRKESIEIVKLAANESGMGGTSALDESGATVMSESGLPSGKEMTVQGKATCSKCQLHETAKCQKAVQVKDGDKTTTYYLAQNDVSKNFHEDLCKEGKQVTVTGTLQEVAGKLELTPSKIEVQ